MGERRKIRRPTQTENQKQLVTRRLREMDARAAETEGRLAGVAQAMGQDIVMLRQMLLTAITAMEEHDVTIAALRQVLNEALPGSDAKVDAARERLIRLKEAAAAKNEELANKWNAQLRAMEAEGVSQELLAEIFHTAKRTGTEPDLVRMQLAQGDAPEVPAGAFEFRMS